VRVILDTNVFVSGLIRRDSPPGQILELWFEGRFTLLSHVLLLDELRTVTRRDRIRAMIRPSEAGRLVNQIPAASELVSELPHVRRSTDPADDFLLAMCEAGRADYLVSGDKSRLLILGRHESTIILTARKFYEVLSR